MSEPPKNNLPPRRVSTVRPAAKPTGSGATDSPNSAMRQTNVESRSTGVPTRSASGSGVPPRRPVNVNTPPRNDPFPYIMAGVIVALVLGLVLVVFLVTSPKSPNNSAGNVTNDGGATSLPVAGQGNTQAPSAQSTVVNLSTSVTSIEPIRMPITDFLTLYNDPAKRPIIVDVRTKDAYEAGHIAGAISVPYDQVDAHMSELPKDKNILAYCQ